MKRRTILICIVVLAVLAAATTASKTMVEQHNRQRTSCARVMDWHGDLGRHC